MHINLSKKDAVHMDRGRRGLKLERVYRELYDLDRYLNAYAKLYSNAGAMTPGVTPETVDGTSVDQMNRIIASLREGSFAWQPARRTYIPKANGKKRPLGLPTWTDKLVQEVMRSVLEPYYEAKFRDSSHGFRPGRGCHTALQAIRKTFRGAAWFIEGDIKGCFDNIDHRVLLNAIRESIDDERFVHLIGGMLEAGYVEDWKRHETFSGTPQGGVISPLLANVSLHALDEYVEDILIPENTRGATRKTNPVYARISRLLAQAKADGDRDEWRRLKRLQQSEPSLNPKDPGFRRLAYVRYADDFILAYIGPKAEAEQIKEQISTFLDERLNLEMSAEKTLITHARSEKARFLGYDINVMHDDDQMARGRNPQCSFRKRSINGSIRLEAPGDKIEAIAKKYKVDGKIRKRLDQVPNEDFSIVAWYGSVFRGVANYYCMAHDRARKLSRLQDVMQTSMLKTLAFKHKTSVNVMARKYGTWVETPDGKRRAFIVLIKREGKPDLRAVFGGFSLKREEKETICDLPTFNRNGRTEIVERLLANHCEYCGADGDCEVHHVRKIANLMDVSDRGRREKTPGWVKLMVLRKRKTLVLCRTCHRKLHSGRLD